MLRVVAARRLPLPAPRRLPAQGMPQRPPHIPAAPLHAGQPLLGAGASIRLGFGSVREAGSLRVGAWGGVDSVELGVGFGLPANPSKAAVDPCLSALVGVQLPFSNDRSIGSINGRVDWLKGSALRIR